MLDHNFYIIEKIIRHFYKICLIRLMVLFKFTLNEDFSVDLNTYIFLNMCSKRIIDKDGKLIVKFRNCLDNFYAQGFKELKSDHNFPITCRRMNISNTGITELKVKHIESSLDFNNTKLINLEIESVGSDYFCLDGDLSNIRTFANIPVNANAWYAKPFKHYITDDYKNLNIGSFPRTQIYLEMILFITKREITGLKYNNIADSNHFYSCLFNMINSNKKLLGVWEPWASHIEVIKWPEGFLNENFEKSIKSINKFAL